MSNGSVQISKLDKENEALRNQLNTSVVSVTVPSC